MKVLAISDKVEDKLYGPGCQQNYNHVDMVVSCGDLPYYYVEYVLNALDKPLYYVRGNHANKVEYAKSGNRTEPRGAVDLHNRVIKQNDLLIAGIQGSLRYNRGSYQYSPSEMWGFVYKMVPRLFFNRLTTGRFLDLFVTHAPPFGIHDKLDPAHIGAKAFTWLIQVFKPRVHLHGHIHRYHPADPVRTRAGETLVVNAYGYQELVIPPFLPIAQNGVEVIGQSRLEGDLQGK